MSKHAYHERKVRALEADKTRLIDAAVEARVEGALLIVEAT